jgi:hypothetical protein
MQAEDTVDIALLLTTTGFALWLANHKKQEPDWTWLEVVAGTAVVLLAAGLRSRVQPAQTWQDHERNVWRSFVLGGIPIICGEISQGLAAWRDREAWKAGEWRNTG